MDAGEAAGGIAGEGGDEFDSDVGGCAGGGGGAPAGPGGHEEEGGGGGGVHGEALAEWGGDGDRRRWKRRLKVAEEGGEGKEGAYLGGVEEGGAAFWASQNGGGGGCEARSRHGPLKEDVEESTRRGQNPPLCYM